MTVLIVFVALVDVTRLHFELSVLFFRERLSEIFFQEVEVQQHIKVCRLYIRVPLWSGVEFCAMRRPADSIYKGADY